MIIFTTIVFVLAALSTSVSAGLSAAQAASAYAHAHPLARQVVALDYSSKCGRSLGLVRRDLEDIITRAIDDTPSAPFTRGMVIDRIEAGLSRRPAGTKRQRWGSIPTFNYSNSMCTRETLSRRELEDLVSRALEDVQILDRRSKGPNDPRWRRGFVKRLTDGVMGAAVLKRSRAIDHH